MKQNKRKQKRSAKQDAQAIVRAEHQALALELRKRGHTYREIADKMAEAPAYDAEGKLTNFGIGRVVPMSTLYDWVSTGIKAIPIEAASELRQMHLERLDTLLAKAWTEVAGSERLEEKALKKVLQLMDRQARYCGLYAPEGSGGGYGADRIADAIENLEADRPILRPDEAPPANPIL